MLSWKNYASLLWAIFWLYWLICWWLKLHMTSFITLDGHLVADKKWFNIWEYLGVTILANFWLQTQSNLCFLDNTMQRCGKETSSPYNVDNPSRATSLPFKTNELWACVFFFFFTPKQYLLSNHGYWQLHALLRKCLHIPVWWAVSSQASSQAAAWNLPVDRSFFKGCMLGQSDLFLSSCIKSSPIWFKST